MPGTTRSAASPPLAWLAALNRGLAGAVYGALAFAVGAMVLVVVLQIAARLAGVTLIWTSEVTQFLMLWVSFLGTTAGYRAAEHIGVDVFVDRLPAGARRIAALGIEGLILVFFGLFCIYGIEYTLLVHSAYAATLDISMFWAYLPIPLCMGVAALTACERILAILAGEAIWHRPDEDGLAP